MIKTRINDDPVLTGQLLFAASIFGRFLFSSAWFRGRGFQTASQRPQAIRTIEPVILKQNPMKMKPVVNKIAPPVPQKIYTNVYHGFDPNDPDKEVGDNPMNPPIVRRDPYYWLRDDDRKDSKVIDYLTKENDYFQQEMEGLKPFQTRLYEEMLSHLKETDEEVPYKHDNYYYYSKTIKGKSYKIHCRKAIISQNPEILGLEEVILDENIIAEGQEYCDIEDIEMSPNHTLLAYTVDFCGDETYAVRIRSDMSKGTELDDVINDTTGDVLWGNDESTLFYMTMDEEHRPDKVYLHTIGTSQTEDICLFEENDGRYWVTVSKTSDHQYLVIGLDGKESCEYWFVNMHAIHGAAEHRAKIRKDAFQCFRSRALGIRYEDIEHYDGYFYFITNLNDAKNQKIMRCPVSYYDTIRANKANTTEEADAEEEGEEEGSDEDNEEDDEDSTEQVPSPPWEDIRPYNPEEQIDDMLVFAESMAIFGRYRGVAALWIISAPKQSIHDWQLVPFDEEDYTLTDGANMEYHTNMIRLIYTSFLTPKQVIDYNMHTGERTILKQQEVPLYDKSLYTSKRFMALSRDGKTKIPMSAVYHRKLFRPDVQNNPLQVHHQPVLLYGYGSYGDCIDPSFDFKRLALLDRGVIYIFAHIRGGGEMGRVWYEEEGKYLTKMNTFYDFIDCIKYLNDSEITTSSQVCIVGRSAGGLLIGGVCNLLLQEETKHNTKQSYIQAAVADVPFVDVLTTMSDPSIPLTITEWEEWGNPNEKQFFDYMSKYSPYDNVQDGKEYPALFVTAGLHDPRVAYWEPAKWVARLRESKAKLASPSETPLLFKTDMSSGHFSASDRYKYISETALEYSFVLDQINAKELV